MIVQSILPQVCHRDQDPTADFPCGQTIRCQKVVQPTLANGEKLSGFLTLGLGVSIPLRVFDRNQGENQRTLIDIDRSQQLTDATTAQVFSDVDSSYEQLRSSIALLKPYKAQYRDQATRVRDTVTYAYQRGGASLMDFLNAQSDYRVVQLAYLQLVGSYMTAASQVNLAVGHEVIP